MISEMFNAMFVLKVRHMKAQTHVPFSSYLDQLLLLTGVKTVLIKFFLLISNILIEYICEKNISQSSVGQRRCTSYMIFFYSNLFYAALIKEHLGKDRFATVAYVYIVCMNSAIQHSTCL